MLHQLLGNDKANVQQDYQQLQMAYRSDSDFSCKQPAYAAYFQRRSEDPSELRLCNAALPLLVRGRDARWQVYWLDPQRVRAVHLMFAGQSSSVASRFGHVALRLIVCPDKAAVQAASPDRCDVNVQEHLVLGFQAYVDDSSLSIHRALWGGYQARLVAQHFMEAYQQYTTAEFRELYSVPLIMDAQQQQELIQGLVQLHWAHESDYRFLSSNCSTLLQDALAALWPQYHQTSFGTQRIRRPNVFFERIKTSDLLDAAVLDNPQLVLRHGYFFSSNEQAYRTAAAMLAAAMQQPFFTGLESYLATPVTLRREALQQDAVLQAALVQNPRLRVAPLLLEELAMLQAERDILRASAQVWQLKKGQLYYQSRHALDDTQQVLISRCLMAPIQSLMQSPPRHSIIPSEPQHSTGNYQPCSAEQKQQLRQLLEQEQQDSGSGWHRVMVAMQQLADIIDHLEALQQARQEHKDHVI